MTTTTEQDNAALCKNCNSPLGNHIIPKNNCPHGFDYYHAERFFEPMKPAPTPELFPADEMPFNLARETLPEMTSEERESYLDTLPADHQRIQIFPPGGNICEHPFARKKPEWAYHTHAVIKGKYGCRISGDYLCHDTSIEDQNGLPTCPTCAKKVTKARQQPALI